MVAEGLREAFASFHGMTMVGEQAGLLCALRLADAHAGDEDFKKWHLRTAGERLALVLSLPSRSLCSPGSLETLCDVYATVTTALYLMICYPF